MNERLPDIASSGDFPIAVLLSGQGRTLANLVEDGTWLPLAGMGHDMPAPLWPTLMSAIKRHAARADTRATI